MRLLVLMAKQPIPGKTKTRLIPPLSEKEAAELYRAFLQDKVLQMQRVAGTTLAIGFAPPEARDYFEELAPDFEYIEQRGRTLSARLISVFDQAFAAGYSQVMAIDGDTPTLPPDYLEQGLTALSAPETDMVLGPSADGGYYAIGMKQHWPALFQVEMSTPRVAQDTLAAAAELDLTVHCLPSWRDVDRPDDLEALRRSLQLGLPENSFAAPATRRQLLSDGTASVGKTRDDEAEAIDNGGGITK